MFWNRILEVNGPFSPRLLLLLSEQRNLLLIGPSPKRSTFIFLLPKLVILQMLINKCLTNFLILFLGEGWGISFPSRAKHNPHFFYFSYGSDTNFPIEPKNWGDASLCWGWQQLGDFSPPEIHVLKFYLFFFYTYILPLPFSVFSSTWGR